MTEWENHLITIVKSFARNFKADVFYGIMIFIPIKGGTQYDLVMFTVCFGLLFTLPMSNNVYLTDGNRSLPLYPAGCTLLALNLGFSHLTIVSPVWVEDSNTILIYREGVISGCANQDLQCLQPYPLNLPSIVSPVVRMESKQCLSKMAGLFMRTFYACNVLVCLSNACVFLSALFFSCLPGWCLSAFSKPNSCYSEPQETANKGPISGS